MSPCQPSRFLPLKRALNPDGGVLSLPLLSSPMPPLTNPSTTNPVIHISRAIVVPLLLFVSCTAPTVIWRASQERQRLECTQPPGADAPGSPQFLRSPM